MRVAAYFCPDTRNARRHRPALPKHKLNEPPNLETPLPLFPLALFCLLADDGFTSRGHRKRLLDATFRVAGVACGDHKLGAMCAITRAVGFTDGAAAVTAQHAQPVVKTLSPLPA